MLGLALAWLEHRGSVALPDRLGRAALDWFGLPRLIDRIGQGGAWGARWVDQAAARLPQPAQAGPATLALARTAASVPERDRVGRPTLRLARAAREGLERGLDAIPRHAAICSLGGARGFDRFDRRAIDGAIAAIDRGLGAGAGLLARAQRGLLHHYCAGVALGAAALLLLALMTTMR